MIKMSFLHPGPFVWRGSNLESRAGFLFELAWGNWEWVGQNWGAQGQGGRCPIPLTVALALPTSPLPGLAAPWPPWINLASYH